MFLKKLVGLIILLNFTTSCVTMKDLKLFQPNENTVLNEYGLIQHTYEPYRLQVDDYVKVMIETQDPNAKEFFSSKNIGTGSNSSNLEQSGSRIMPDGYVHVLGLGSIYLLGLTQDQASAEVQKIVDEIYLENMAIARVYVETLNFTVLGEVSSPGMKKSNEVTINLFEAVAMCGDFTNYSNRKNVHLWRQYPEGIKRIDIDLTREDIINSPYFYLHPNDFIQIDPIPEKIIGIGGGTIWGDFNQFISIIAYSIGTYALINRL